MSSLLFDKIAIGDFLVVIRIFLYSRNFPDLLIINLNLYFVFEIKLLTS